MSGWKHHRAQAQRLRLALEAEDRRGDGMLVVDAGSVEDHQLVRAAFTAWSALVLARLDDALDEGPEAVIPAYADAVRARPALARVVARHRLSLDRAWRRHARLVGAAAGRDVAPELAALLDRTLMRPATNRSDLRSGAALRRVLCHHSRATAVISRSPTFGG